MAARLPDFAPSKQSKDLDRFTPADSAELRHLSADPYNPVLYNRRHSKFLSHLKARPNGVFDVNKRFLFAFTLANASWNGRTLDDPHGVLVLVKPNIEVHVLILQRRRS